LDGEAKVSDSGRVSPAKPLGVFRVEAMRYRAVLDK